MVSHSSLDYVGYIIVLVLVIFLIAVILGILIVPALREGSQWNKKNNSYKARKKRRNVKIAISLLIGLLIISIMLAVGIFLYNTP